MKNCSTLNIWSGIFVLKTNFFHIAITSDRILIEVECYWPISNIQYWKPKRERTRGKSELKIDNEIQFNSILSEIERCACLQQTTAQKWNGAINESADKNVSQLSKQNIFHVEPGFFGVSFCHCGSIVIGGYWIVNILSWIIQAIFSIAFAFLKQVERDFFYPQSSISHARNFPFCSSSPISYFASPFAPLRSFLRLLCCHWLPFFPTLHALFITIRTLARLECA